MQLEGSLKEFSLAELIRMVVSSAVTGVLDLSTGQRSVRIYSRDGKIYHAAAGAETGPEAFFTAFEYSDGEFRFVAGEVAEEETIWQDSWELITQAERRAESWMRVRPYIPAFSCRPALRQLRPEQRVSVAETGWKVLAHVDGERSIEEIARRLGQVPIEVAMALLDLIQQGVVSIQAPRSAVVPALAEPHRIIQSAPPATPVDNRSIWQRLRSRN